MINPYTNQYTPQMYSQYMYPGMYQQVQPTPQDVRQSSIMVAQVPTIEHVEQVQMSPGERKIVLVQNDPNFLAIRVADNAGFVTTEYRTSQIVDPKSMRGSQAQYATVQALMDLREDVNRLKNIIGGGVNAKPAYGDAAGAE